MVYHPSVPILITDDERHYRDASAGAGKLLGLSRHELIGQRLDDFTDPSVQPRISDLWSAFLGEGEQQGTFRLAGPDGTLWDVEYTAKGNVLPVRHLLVLRDTTTSTPGAQDHARIPTWVQDYALFLLDPDGRIAAWYSGASRIYGYTSEEAIGKHVVFLYSSAGNSSALLDLNRSVAEGHFGSEGWHVREDGSRFWANVITMALRDQLGVLQGFARVVRDFADRHEADEKLRRSRSRVCLAPAEATIAGIVSGEFDHIPDANDAFLNMVGYSREDLMAGRLHWPELTPAEFTALDDLAHEEALRFGACSPYEKKLLHKDGSRIPVLVATAVLKLSTFRWITFVQDLSERNLIENMGDEAVEGKQNFEEMVGNSGP